MSSISEVDPKTDEAALAEAAADGDRDALELLLRRFLPSIRGLAGRHTRGRPDDREDYEQVAALAMIEAIGRYQPSRGPLAPFLTTSIVGALKRYSRDSSWKIRMPRSTHDAWVAVERMRPDLVAELGREPTSEELEKFTGLTAGQITDTTRAAVRARPVSMDSLVQGEPATMHDVVGDEDQGFVQAEGRAELRGLLRGLDERSRRLLTLRFGLDLTQSEIAERVGISQMHVSRLIHGALSSVRGRVAR